jgi:hypothetical protein
LRPQPAPAENRFRAAIFEANVTIAGRNYMYDQVGDEPHLFYQCYDGKEKKGVSHGKICRVPLRIVRDSLWE